MVVLQLVCECAQNFHHLHIFVVNIFYISLHVVFVDTNPRFAGKKFRDSIGEEEFAAATTKSRCWDRAAEWYDYCGLAEQSDDAYLNVSFPSDGAYYVEPAVNCSCDSWGAKQESGFGLERQFCTRNVSAEPLCYRKAYADYWAEWDILCEDLSDGHNCSTTYCFALSFSLYFGVCALMSFGWRWCSEKVPGT